MLAASRAVSESELACSWINLRRCAPRKSLSIQVFCIRNTTEEIAARSVCLGLPSLPIGRSVASCCSWQGQVSPVVPCNGECFVKGYRWQLEKLRKSVKDLSLPRTNCCHLRRTGSFTENVGQSISSSSEFVGRISHPSSPPPPPSPLLRERRYEKNTHNSALRDRRDSETAPPRFRIPLGSTRTRSFR